MAADAMDLAIDEDNPDEGDLLQDFQHVVISCTDPVAPTEALLKLIPDAEEASVNGKKGQAVRYIAEEDTFIVATFDGDLVALKQECLQQFTPLPPEHGGFDCIWPGHPSRVDAFTRNIVDVLSQKNFCVIQMSTKTPVRKLACEALLKKDVWHVLWPEFEEWYSGSGPRTKTTWSIPDDTEEKENELELINQAMHDLTGSLSSESPQLGFNIAQRSNLLVRTSLSDLGEERALFDKLWGSESMVASDMIQDFIGFHQRKKLCLLYVAQGSGCTLTLKPNDDSADAIDLPCQENHLVVFRHDLLDYSLNMGTDVQPLVLQSWALREAHKGESELRVGGKGLDVSQVPSGIPYGSTNETVDCMSLAAKLAGGVWDSHMLWAILMTGVDACGVVPLQRWDHDQYWSPNGETPGTAYVRHFGMLEDDQMMLFDNNMFGISDREASLLDPTARNLCEVGYDCFHRAGFTKETLRGQEVGFCYGYGGSELFSRILTLQMGPVQPDDWVGASSGAVASRLAYCLNMKGPTATTETACSSSLTATALAHSWVRPSEYDEVLDSTMRRQIKQILVQGSCAQMEPFFTIGLCGASMLTHQGRCFTFDNSADGFIRGEGTAAMYYRVNEMEDQSRLAMLCGSNMNQDGRSASLTAPHGPSQQECIRYSLREAGIRPLDIQMQELHGTGTPLGDPIEVGAVRATMMADKGEVRSHPLVNTSSKSNIGHGEITAGIVGIMKCVLLGCHASAAPNVHLRVLNPHIDSNGYPVLFDSELVDQGKNIGFMGVSSFGFGGSNARGDIWGRAQCGHRNSSPGKMPFDHSSWRILTYSRIHCTGTPQQIGYNEGAAAYYGNYALGNPFKDRQLVFFLCGTFNGWSWKDEMKKDDATGRHFALLRLGDTKVEEFQIRCNYGKDYCIFPIRKKAGPGELMLGPGQPPPAHNWVIDGRDGPPDAVYRVELWWDEAKQIKRISWEPSMNDDTLAVAEEAYSHSYQRKYFVVGSWTAYYPIEMVRLAGETDVYQTTVRIESSGQERFQIHRDKDKLMAIYPAQDGGGGAVRGPDGEGSGKYWVLKGKTGEEVKIQLKIGFTGYDVLVIQPTKGIRIWRSSPSHKGHLYFITGAWNNWGFTIMTPETTCPGVFRVRFVARSETVDFQIVVDESLRQAIYPDMDRARSGTSSALGPDAFGAGRHWRVTEAPGTLVEVTLDTTQRDRRKLVTWRAMPAALGA